MHNYFVMLYRQMPIEILTKRFLNEYRVLYLNGLSSVPRKFTHKARYESDSIMC